MGCPCNKANKPQTKVSKVKSVIKRMWEKTQIEEKPLKTKEINKS